MPDRNRAPRRKTKPTGLGRNRPEPQTYTVYVEDNFSAMARDTRWTLGTYATYDKAVEAAKQFVERSLANAQEPGMKVRQLLDHYADFGDEPLIVPVPEGQLSFRARIHAEDTADDICRAGSAGSQRMADE